MGGSGTRDMKIWPKWTIKGGVATRERYPEGGFSRSRKEGPRGGASVCVTEEHALSATPSQGGPYIRRENTVPPDNHKQYIVW